MKRLDHSELPLLGVADFVSAPVRVSFAEDLAEQTSRILGLDQVQIGCIDALGEHIEVRAAWHAGRQPDTWSYSLSNTVSAAVLREGSIGLERGARNAYPADPDLQRLEAEGFLGATIPGTDGGPMGLISGCSSRPLSRPDLLLAALRILAAHAGAVFAVSANQERLRHERLQLHRALIDNFPFAVWLKDTQYRFLAVNQAFADAVGADTTDELVGKTEAEIGFPGLTANKAVSDREAQENRRKLQGEHEILCDGIQRWLEIYKGPVIDTNGDLLGTLGFARDISDRKQAERELAKQRERMRLILDNAPIGIWLQHPSGRFDFVNRTFCEAVGVEEERFLAVSHYSELIPESFMKQCLKSDARAMAEPGVVVANERLTLADGQVHDMRVIKFVKRDAQGNPEALVGISLDITEELRKERALRESEARFHTMLDWTYDWEYWIRPDGSFCYMTPSAEHFTGYPSTDFERDPGLLDSLIHPDDKALWEQHVKGALLSPGHQEVCELEFRIQHKDGSLLWVEHRCRPVTDASGEHRGRRVSISDITARKEAEEQIRNLAYFDPLTKLPNRRLLLDRLVHTLVASRRSHQYGALLMIDLDNFKSLNDTQGHDVGDRLLVEVAQRMTASLRAEDTVARLGGDEYVVMLETLGNDERTAANEAETIAEKIRLILNDPYPIIREGQTHYCSCSIGLTLFQGDRQSVDVLLKQADVALYQAKDAGRNTIRFFNPEMQKAIDSRIALESALRQALLRGELQLFYQPQIDQHGRRIGAEALLRWMHPHQGLVPPLDFIPLAEETGLIVPIGRWVVDTACAQLKAWESCPTTRLLQLAVNVSARQFHQPDFVAQVRDSLERSNANPARLKLELTESVVLENADSVIERMHQLRELGVSFSMDDFGTGYSSLSYLKRLPLDQLKIDKSFVRDITTDPNDAAIVRAILAMSRSLGIQVIAEGVETEEQQLFLLDNGCFAFQGYLFGKPIPIVEWRQQSIQTD